MVNRIAIYSSIFLTFISTHLIAGEMIHGMIEKDIDGDTVWVQSAKNRAIPDGSKGTASDNRLKIRMLGIDAPESHLVTPHGVVGQGKWGTDAFAYLSELIPVGVAVQVQSEGKDVYGRTLGRIFRSGDDVNLKMVESGLAITYVICDGPGCNASFFHDQNVEAYIDACRRAQRAGKGIFDPRSPLQEMPFEFRLRMQNRAADKYVGDYESKKLYQPKNYRQVPLCQRIFFLKEASGLALGFEATYQR